jgi:hypothetical protein
MPLNIFWFFDRLKLLQKPRLWQAILCIKSSPYCRFLRHGLWHAQIKACQINVLSFRVFSSRAIFNIRNFRPFTSRVLTHTPSETQLDSSSLSSSWKQTTVTIFVIKMRTIENEILILKLDLLKWKSSIYALPRCYQIMVQPIIIRCQILALVRQSVSYFMTLSVWRLCSVARLDKLWMTNLKFFGMKRSWPKRGNIPKFAVRDKGYLVSGPTLEPNTSRIQI